MPRQPYPLDRVTPERIAETALAILDSAGPGALSFRSLAQHLGVSHMTIYRRCSDLDGLLDLCVDHLAAYLPDSVPGSDWARVTETRFTGLYILLTTHPGLMALRGARPWLGEQLLRRLVEPAVGDNIAVGMSAQEAVLTYRRMYLLTLGCASFVDHRNPNTVIANVRTTITGLDPQEFPALTGNLEAILPIMSDDEIYYGALRQLIRSARPETSEPPAGSHHRRG
ncbi:TetR/AcrR family transcriptional regulator [Allokutzneria oryzae]|uniref:TetR/AcrR family transcriptional regulator n=1 Tax=Allokutzneria oryzae TaxID=1378989 RepID=A0ABV5ZUW7_9PSEU